MRRERRGGCDPSHLTTFPSNGEEQGPEAVTLLSSPFYMGCSPERTRRNSRWRCRGRCTSLFQETGAADLVGCVLQVCAVGRTSTRKESKIMKKKILQTSRHRQEAAGSATRLCLIMSEWISTTADAGQRPTLQSFARGEYKVETGTSAFRLRSSKTNNTSILFLRCCRRECPRLEHVLQNRKVGGPKPRF